MSEAPRPLNSAAEASPGLVRRKGATQIELVAPSATERYLTAREVADRMGLHVKTVLRYVRVAGLPACRLPGGDLRFAWPEVSGWLGARREARR